MRNNKVIAFVFGRLFLGMSMFGHGAIRLPKLTAFSEGMLKQFAESPLPEILVLPFSYLIPLAEFLVGLLLLIGFFTRGALIGTGLVVLSLIFGTCMIENWNALVPQLLHGAFVIGLLVFADTYNGFSLDKYSAKTR